MQEGKLSQLCGEKSLVRWWCWKKGEKMGGGPEASASARNPRVTVLHEEQRQTVRN